jgi:trypsin
MVIVVGDYNKDSSSDQFEATYTVARVISHPGYNSGTMDNDFALIELTEDVVMNECVGTVCLPEEDVEDQTMCYITGWGTLSSGGSTPSILQEGLVGVVSNADCNTRYNGEILDSMLCAQGSATGGIVDACQGDSGGPLVCEGAPGAYVLHGATSWGYGCAQAQYPGVWARVWYVMDWVNSYVTDAGTGGPSLPSNITTEVSGAMPPQGATHLLAFSVWGQDMNMTPAALSSLTMRRS